VFDVVLTYFKNAVLFSSVSNSVLLASDASRLSTPYKVAVDPDKL
jgi:hypothetical protein